jgi:hypothetical protein
MTEEHIEKQDKVVNQMENKKKMVLDFLSKGDGLMQDPNCPKFLEGHAKKLKETWEDTTHKAQDRKKALAGTLMLFFCMFPEINHLIHPSTPQTTIRRGRCLSSTR